jgi:hypothetical protein
MLSISTNLNLAHPAIRNAVTTTKVLVDIPRNPLHIHSTHGTSFSLQPARKTNTKATHGRVESIGTWTSNSEPFAPNLAHTWYSNEVKVIVNLSAPLLIFGHAGKEWEGNLNKSLQNASKLHFVNLKRRKKEHYYTNVEEILDLLDEIEHHIPLRYHCLSPMIIQHLLSFACYPTST